MGVVKDEEFKAFSTLISTFEGAHARWKTFRGHRGIPKRRHDMQNQNLRKIQEFIDM